MRQPQGLEFFVKFSVLHISDLHRDLDDEIENGWLLQSLRNDFEQFSLQRPEIVIPRIAVVTGDLIYGAPPGKPGIEEELQRQYEQAEEFLVGLADQFFGGDRSRVVLLPGNHDICDDDVMASVQRIAIPTEMGRKSALVSELFKPRSSVRWSWRELCFYRIVDHDRYRARLRYFSEVYSRFLQRKAGVSC